MSPVFIDTSYVLALELKDDQNHDSAATHWQGVLASRRDIVTTSYIFDEIVRFFNRRGHHQKASQVGNARLQSPSVRLLHVDPDLFEAAWAYFERHPDTRSDKRFQLPAPACLQAAEKDRSGGFTPPSRVELKGEMAG